MAVSFNLVLALIQILKTKQQTFSTLKMKKDQQQVPKAQKTVFLYRKSL